MAKRILVCILAAHALSDIQYDVGDVVEMDESTAAAHSASGMIDTHPDAVAYAKSLGAKQKSHPAEKPKKTSAKEQAKPEDDAPQPPAAVPLPDDSNIPVE